MKITLVRFIGLALTAFLTIVVVGNLPIGILSETTVQAQPPQSELDAARQAALAALNDRAQYKATIREVVVEDNFALAGWLRGEGGGNILMKKQNGNWERVTSGGGSLGLQGLIDYGVPEPTAKKLWEKYKSAR
jgi:hypothetical protein